MKLHEMKKIAQYALNHELTAIEIDQLNGQLNELKREVHCLEKQLHSFGHQKEKGGVFVDIALMSMALSQGQVQQQASMSVMKMTMGNTEQQGEKLFRS